jgi:hypothetical protein
LAKDRIIAVGLLTQRDVDVLGQGFSRLWPVDETPCFADLLQAIDDSDRELQRKPEMKAAMPAAGGGRH